MKVATAGTEVVEAATTAASEAMKAAAATTKATATTETTAAATKATPASKTAPASTKATASETATAAAVSDERSGRSGCQVPGCEPTRRGIGGAPKAENACDETTEQRTM